MRSGSVPVEKAAQENVNLLSPQESQIVRRYAF
jgi:hypothetical protein